MRRPPRTSAVLPVAAICLTLTACAGGSSGSDQDTLQVAYWNYGPSAEQSNQALATGFEDENPGSTVDLMPVAGENWGSYYANLSTLIAAGERPDLSYISSEGVKFLDQNGLVLPINDYLDSDPDAEAIRADIAPGLLDTFAVGEDITALPNGWNNMVVYYNTAVFAEAGVQPPQGDWTWADFASTAAELTADTDGDGRTDRFGFAWASNEIFPGILPWVANAGGNLVSDDVCQATADSAPVTEALTFLTGLLDDGSAAAPMPMSDIFTRFQTGEVAMFGAGRWPTATFLPAGFTDFDIRLYPTGSTYRTVIGAAGYPILTSAQNPDLAWEFQKYSASAQVQDAQIGTPDAPRDAIPSLRSSAERTVAAGIPPESGDLFYASVDEFASLTPFPAPAKYSEYEATVLRWTQLIFGGETTVAEGLSGLQDDLSAIVAC